MDRAADPPPSPAAELSPLWGLVLVLGEIAARLEWRSETERRDRPLAAAGDAGPNDRGAR